MKHPNLPKPLHNEVRHQERRLCGHCSCCQQFGFGKIKLPAESPNTYSALGERPSRSSNCLIHNFISRFVESLSAFVADSCLCNSPSPSELWSPAELIAESTLSAAAGVGPWLDGCPGISAITLVLSPDSFAFPAIDGLTEAFAVAI